MRLTLKNCFIILIFCWILFYFLAFFPYHNHFSVFTLQLLRINATALLFIAAFFSAGSIIAESLFAYKTAGIEKAVVGLALGAGSFSLLTLIFGLCGIFNGWFFFALLLIFFFSGFSCFKSWANYAKTAACNTGNILCAPFLYAALIIWALLGTYSFLPPLAFDVLEFHLAVPKEYLELGRITHLPHNVFSNLPMNANMIFTAALGTWPENLSGTAIATLINYSFTLASSAALYCLGRLCFKTPAAAWLAFCASLLSPVLLQHSFTAFVEPQLTFYVVLSVHLVIKNMALKNYAALEWLLSGIITGFAMGTKLTGMGILFPLLFIIIMFCRREKAAWFFLGAISSVSPWLIKNILFIKTPFSPLFSYTEIFRKALFSYFHQPHQFNIIERINSFFIFLSPHDLHLTALLIFAALFIALRKQALPVLKVWFLCCGFFILWFFITVQDLRYLTPLGPLIYFLCVYTVFSVYSFFTDKPLNKLLYALFFILIITQTTDFFSLPLIETRIMYQINPTQPKKEVSAFLQGKTLSGDGYNWMHALDKNEKILMIADAGYFYAPTGTFYSTIYNQNPVVEIFNAYKTGRLRQWFAEKKITYIYVNFAEWQRYDQSFLVPENFDKKDCGGYVPDKKAQQWFLDDFIPHYTKPINYSPQKANPQFMLYKISFPDDTIQH